MKLILALLFTALPAFAQTGDDSGIYFHWGDIGGNRTLLQAGGYQGPEHFEDIDRGTDADMNEAVLAQARQWYVKAGKGDVAGAGFYLTPDLFNSRNFGNDLLIVEIVNSAGRGFMEVDANIKTAADAALKAGQFDALPLMTLYHTGNAVSGWRVISRPPNAEERKHISIRFRSPKSGDVGAIWKKITSVDHEQTMAVLGKIAGEINGDPGTPVTRSADIVFQRLLFDHAPEYLSERIKDGDLTVAADGTIKGFRNFAGIGKAFAAKIPNDPRIGKLVLALSEKLAAPAAKIKDKEVFLFVADNAGSVEAGPRAKVADWIFASFDPGLLKANFGPMMKLIASVIAQSDPAAKLALRKYVLDNFEQGRLSAKDFLTSREELQKIFGVRGRAMAAALLLNETKRLAQVFSSVHIYDRQVNRSNGKEPTEARDELWEQALLISGLAAKAPSQETDKLIRDFVSAVHATSPVPLVEELRSHIALELFDKVAEPAYREFLKQYVRADQAKKTAIYRQKVEANYREDQDPNVIKIIRRFARAAGLADADTGDPQKLRYALWKLPVKKRLEKTIDNVSQKTPDIMSYGPFSGYLEQYIKTGGMTAAQFEKRFSFLLEQFPEHAADLEKAATSQQEHGYSALTIAWARLTREAQLVAQNNGGNERKIHDAYLHIRNANTQAGIPGPDEMRFKQLLRRTFQNVPGHQGYSELSRIFNLVDPLFVSEDIRLMNAARPQDRFNEELHADGRVITQPAWENFNEAWETMAVTGWLRDSHTAPKKIAWVFSSLSAVHKKLIETRVDGTPSAATRSGEWDRTKYTTFISNEDWQEWNVEGSKLHLERYFTVEKTDAGYNLKFRESDSLLERAIGILRYSERQWSFEYALMHFIYYDSSKLKDPVQRAARILFLMTRLHPHENGNGRFGRLWAATELMNAGLPMPVGFPTNDFLMSQRHLELEVRRSLKLGTFWEAMIADAKQKGISDDDFFQKVFRGSALEGLMHISPTRTEDLAAYVEWLEAQKSVPAWAADFGRDIERRLYELHSGGGRLAKMSESERSRLVSQAWKEFHARLTLAPKNPRALKKCEYDLMPAS